MKKAVALLSLLSSASAGLAGDMLREVSWSRLAEAGEVLNGKVLPADEKTSFERLKVANDTDRQRSITVLTLKDPGVTKSVYAIHGRVRYEDVAGKGYLEMWNHFSGVGMYYSRTLAAAGPMAPLTGSSDWRPFALPFYKQKVKGDPSKLVVNVVLPGRGTVYLAGLRLAEYDRGEDPLAVKMPGAWWSQTHAGWIGAAIGLVCGCLGAAVGLLAGAGKSRGFVLGAMKSMLGAGVVGLIVGGVALIQSQPYAVYYPLLLAGGLLAVLSAGLLPIVRRRYEQIELRKIEAMDTP